MKPCLSLSVLLAAGLFPAVALLRAADPSPVPPDGKTRLTGRIDALLRPHLKPAPLPVVLPNPFIVVRGTADLAETHDPAAPGAANPAPPADDSPLLTDAETLARGVARLKIGGTMQVNDATQLIINQEPHKEGDYVILENKGALLYVQISRLTPAELTLRFREATRSSGSKTPPSRRMRSRETTACRRLWRFKQQEPHGRKRRQGGAARSAVCVPTRSRLE